MPIRFFTAHAPFFIVFTISTVFAFSSSLFSMWPAAAPLTPLQRFEIDLTKGVIRKSANSTNCGISAEIALELLERKPPFFRVLDHKENIIDWTSVEAGVLRAQKISFILPELIRPVAKGRVALFPMAHAFLLFRSTEEWRICDSFQSVHRFECRGISQEAVRAVEMMIKRYAANQSVENYRDLLSVFLYQVEINRIFSSFNFKSEKHHETTVNRNSVKKMRAQTPEQINRRLRSARYSKDDRKETRELSLASLAQVSVISSTSFIVPL
jgi:hypothetical protein